MYEDLTPAEVVAYLDRYIVGQVKAKRAVAVALRNRLRRKRLDPKIAEEVIPKNILMIGPTGVGKTEIARRLAALVNAPFVKVEATKFTEVGYVGRDVESMIRDLVEVAVHMVKARHMEAVQSAAAERAEERLLDLLLPLPRKQESMQDFVKVLMGGVQERIESPREREDSGTRERLREMLRAGKLDTREVEVEVAESAVANVPVLGVGLDEMGINLSEMLGNLLPKRMKRKRMSVSSARVLLQAEEAEKLIDMESVVQEALTKVQEEGIVFLDELDKVASQDGAQHGPDVSREGVQRDLLPIVEGSTVMTKYGPVKTDYILFIAAGAFHRVKPSDLVP
ncbi:MAG TPA: ATP-dependent protease ATPase subunit HslU, partial [Thermosynergistes sp.]|nr:ATP-dependent protease ATPase subunit HslU [Thermosynergistes sp.]